MCDWQLFTRTWLCRPHAMDEFHILWSPRTMKREFEEFWRKNGKAHTCSAPEYPEANGLAERYVGHFKMKMKLMDPRDDIDTRIQRFLFTYRTTPTFNGKSPAKLLDSLFLCKFSMMFIPCSQRKMHFIQLDHDCF